LDWGLPFRTAPFKPSIWQYRHRDGLDFDWQRPFPHWISALGEIGMPEADRNKEQAVREMAYYIWEREGRPEGRAQDHWVRAIIEGSCEERSREDGLIEDEEKVLAGRPDANIPALLTKDVPGG
jgi:hypothetical protein